MNNHI